MTAISPLESIHKKGIFGDHQKQNEADLLKITEVKNLTIVQIVQYKKSLIQLNSLDIDGLNLPLKELQVSSKNKTRILWSGPNTWLVISGDENVLKKIKEKFNDKDFSVTDISHSRAVIQIKGQQSIEVLKKGCPINFNEFNINNCAGSIFHGINIIVDFVSTDPNTFNLFTLRSFGETFYHHVTDAALEYGFIAI